MLTKQTIIGVRLALGLLAFAALITQFAARAQPSVFSTINFFSFFTVESNILGAVVLLLATGMLWLDKKSAWLDIVRGAATLYMATTGIIYALLLSGLEESLQTTIPWVNLVLHYVMPIVLLLDWLLEPPHRRIASKAVWWWLVFPIAYVAYSLVRGPLADWYPYPFLDPRQFGYGIVAVYCLAVAGVVTLLALGIRFVGNRQARKS